MVCFSRIFIMIVMLSVPCLAHAVTEKIYLAEMDWHTGSVFDDFQTGENGDIRVGPPDWQLAMSSGGWARFDLSSLPDTAEISAVSLSFVVVSGDGAIDIVSLLTDPTLSSTSYQTIGSELLAGVVYGSSVYSTPGKVSVNLAAKAVSDLQGSLSRDWFSLGFLYSQYSGYYPYYIQGWNSGTLRPYLEVQYTLPLPPLTCNFSASVTRGAVPLSVSFVESGTGTSSSIVWNFGDGANSTLVDANHTYSTPGIYSVTLDRTAGSSTCSALKRNLVVVTREDGTVPGFTYRYERAWPSLQQPWYFDTRGLTMDRNGAIYLADGWRNRVVKLTTDGQFLASFGTKGHGAGQFIEAAGVVVDHAGNLYATDRCFDTQLGENGQIDTTACRVLKFNRDGSFITSWQNITGVNDTLLKPTGISLDLDGNILVADSGNNRIVKYSPNGQYLGVMSAYGITAFKSPTDIKVDTNGFLYVVDSGNNLLHKFASFADTALLQSWDAEETGKIFSGPSSLSIADGVILVADSNNQRLVRIGTDGAVTAMIDNGAGSADGQFWNPVATLSDRFGNIYTTEYWNHRVQKFSKNGTFISSWSSASERDGMFRLPHAMTVDAAGNMYVADSANFRIQKFNQQGEFLTSWGSKGNANGQFGEYGGHKGPHAIAVAQDNNIIVADTLNDRLEIFSQEGSFISTVGSYGTALGDFNAPAGLAVAPDGAVYVVEWSGARVQKLGADYTPLVTWGGPGSGDGQFDNPHGITIDQDGFIYIADTLNHRIQKFDSEGNFILKWGTLGQGDDQLYQPWDVRVDPDGNLIVADTYNDRLQRFTPWGQYIDTIGEKGTLFSQFSQPQNISFAPDGSLFVCEALNERLQKFARIESPGNNKAIIVAGGGPYPDNALWDATRANANFAYRSLTYRGFTKQSVYYISDDNASDLDSNGVMDDIDSAATKAALRQAITGWAADADSLVIYLVDHGGTGVFMMNKAESLSAVELAAWLSQLQINMAGRVVVIYDACESGSFLDAFSADQPPNNRERLLITSTSAGGESAYIMNQGALSFSSFFWTQVFNGSDLHDTFAFARQAMEVATRFQHPQLDANLDGSANLPEDMSLAVGKFIGSTPSVTGDAPVIAGVGTSTSDSGKSLNKTSLATIYADGVFDQDGVARVWAIIQPPGYKRGSPNNPVQQLPTIDLHGVGHNRYEIDFSQFNTQGIYNIAVLAKDAFGNTSIPLLTTVTVGDTPLRRRAVLVAGGPAYGDVWSAVAKSIKLAYEGLIFQGYQNDDIYLLSPVAIPAVVKQNLLPTLANLQFALGDNWAGINSYDLLLYCVGNGSTGSFQLDKGENLSAATLDNWLDLLQGKMDGPLTVVLDASMSGSLLPELKPPVGKKRIVITGSGAEQAAIFSSDGDISFSRFFWSAVLDGQSVWDSFVAAKQAVYSAGTGQNAIYDDNGNGIGNEAADGLASRYSKIGMGIRLAGNKPQTSSATADVILNDGTSSSLLFVDDLTAVQKIAKVWAVITPPGAGVGISARAVTDLISVPLAAAGGGRYEHLYNGFTIHGLYSVVIYAADSADGVFILHKLSVLQELGRDVYESDESRKDSSVITINGVAQRHNFHDADDVDWLKFYALAREGVSYDILVDNVESRARVVLEIYDELGNRLLGPQNIGLSGQQEYIANWIAPHDGIYFVKVSNSLGSFGVDTGYNLRIYRPNLPDFGIIDGIVLSSIDLSHVSGAVIIAGNSTAISDATGAFKLYLAPGSINITVDDKDVGQAVVVSKQTSRLDLSVKLANIGDVNGDHLLDYHDAVLSLKVLVDLPAPEVDSGGDIDSDGRIGLPEAVFSLGR